MPPAIISAALVSAAVGAVVAAVSGGNILKGALLGAVGGAIGGAFLGAGGTAGGAASATGEVAAASSLGAATEPVASLSMSGMESAAASGGMGAATEPVSSLAEFGGSTAGATPAPVATSSTGLGPQVTQTGVGEIGPSSALSEPVSSSGLSQTGADSGLFNAAKDSQLANEAIGAKAILGYTEAAQPTALESMYERIFGNDGFMSKPGNRGPVGSALQGFANGATTQKVLDARRAEEERRIANAKFGTQTSRFAPVGLVASAKTPYRG